MRFGTRFFTMQAGPVAGEMATSYPWSASIRFIAPGPSQERASLGASVATMKEPGKLYKPGTGFVPLFASLGLWVRPEHATLTMVVAQVVLRVDARMAGMDLPTWHKELTL